MHDESQPVNLYAVAREREAMAVTAARYPELLTPAANERTAAWLEGDAMRKLDESTEGETKQLAVRLPANLLAVLDAEAARLNALAPGLGLTRADALRSILAAYRPPGEPASLVIVGHGLVKRPEPEPKATRPKPRALSRERYENALANEHTGVEIAKAIGYSDGAALSRWRGGKGTLPEDRADALNAWLTAHDF